MGAGLVSLKLKLRAVHIVWDVVKHKNQQLTMTTTISCLGFNYKPTMACDGSINNCLLNDLI